LNNFINDTFTNNTLELAKIIRIIAMQAPADNQQAIKFEINTQYIKDLSFENPQAPQSLLPGGAPPAISVQVDVNARKLNETAFESVLRLQVKASQEGAPVFVLELQYAGVFTIENATPEQLNLLLLVECPRQLLPFARATVAGITRDAGFPPLMVQPVDFLDLYRRQMMEQPAAGNA
jgi:preprotein translocase subunit SecB